MNGTKKSSRKKRKRTRWSTPKKQYEDSLAYAGNVLFNSTQINTPLPAKLKANFRYSDKNQLNIGAAGIISNQVYNACSLFDPNFTGIGSQPRGFDQLMVLYRKYTVIGSKITVHFIPVSTIGSYIAAINLKSLSTTEALMIDVAESSFSVIDSSNGTSRGPHKLMQTYSPKFTGNTNPLDDEELGGSVSTSPVNSSYYHVSAESATANDEGPIGIFVIIEYTAILHDPYRPAQS